MLSHCRAGDCERRWRRLPRQGIDGGLDSMGAPEREPRPLPVPAAAQWRTRVVRNTSVSKPDAILTAPTMASTTESAVCRPISSVRYHRATGTARAPWLSRKEGKDHEPHPLGRRAGPSVRGRWLLLEQQTRLKAGGAFTSLTGCSITGLRKEGWHQGGGGRAFARLCRKEHPMKQQEVHGKVKKAKGKVKETVGILTGDKKMEREGSLQRAEGAVQEGSARPAGRSARP